nr:biotin/lipoyl-binding protein [Myxococcota bacterium]
NRDFLVTVLEHPKYVEGDLHTHFIDEHLMGALASAPSPLDVAFGALAATFFAHEARRATEPLTPSVPTGFRIHRFAPEVVELTHAAAGIEHVLRVEYAHRTRTPGTFDVKVGHAAHVVRVLAAEGATIRLDVDGHRVSARVVCEGTTSYVHVRGVNLALVERPRFPERVVEVPRGGCVAPMPGKIVKVFVDEGDAVEEGQTLLVMEAMKMEHAVKAPQAGKVARLHVAEGEQVDADALLVLVE